MHDIYDPLTNEKIVSAGEEINELIVEKIEKLPIEKIDVRSPLTCEAKRGLCVKCYGRNLATGKMVQIGEAVGVVAAQSIGEPGTQLTLRTFHVGGIAGNISEENQLISKFDGVTEIDDLKIVKSKDNDGKAIDLVISRTCEIKVLDSKSGIVLSSNVIPYGSSIKVKSGVKIKKDDVICTWDPYNGVIISEFAGKVEYENISILSWISSGAGSEFILIPPNSPLLVEGSIAYSNYDISFQEAASPLRKSGISGFDMGFDFTYFLQKGKVKYGFDIHGFSTSFLTYNALNSPITQDENTSEFSAYVIDLCTVGALTS